jgi:hypothetical protein
MIFVMTVIKTFLNTQKRRWRGMTEDNHEYKCEYCKHKDECIRVSAFLMANTYPYSDGCENFEQGGAE